MPGAFYCIEDETMAAVQAASVVCQSAFFGKTESQNALFQMVPKSKAMTTMKVKSKESCISSEIHYYALRLDDSKLTYADVISIVKPVAATIC